MSFRRPTLLTGLNRWFSRALVCLALAGIAHGQRATLVGLVSDQKGGVVTGVNITLLNLDQGLKREASTNEDGYFTLPLLQPGRYLVTAQKDGFAVAEIKDVMLHVGDVRGLNIELQVAAAPVQVEVTSQPQQVETVSPSLAQVVTGDVIRNAPLNGRDVRDLAFLQPGVTPVDTDSNAPGSFNIAGNRSDSVTYLLDGGLNNDLIDNHAMFTPNPDTIAEYRILTSNYPAEYGRNSGGVITMATQSGSNKLHGSVFDFFRNDALNANSYFNKVTGLPRAVLKRNQFGGTLGGPLSISHVVNGTDRYFFFVGYQGQRQVQALSKHNVSVFTPAELNGDFSQTGRDLDGNPIPDPGVRCFLSGLPTPSLDPCVDQNNNPLIAHTFFQPDPALAAQAIIDPTRINSVARNYINAALIPSAPTGELSSQGHLSLDRDELTSKFDFDFNSKNKLAVTLGWDRVSQVTPFDFADVPGFPDSSEFHDYFATFSYTHIFSLNLLNDLRFTAARSSNIAENPAVKLPTPAQLGIGITPDLATGPTSLVFFDAGLQVGFSFLGPQKFADNTFGYSDTLSWIHGKHSFKFGGGLSAYQSNTFFAFNVDGQFLYFGQGGIGSQNSFADFLLGLPLQYTQSAAAPSNIRTKFYDGFVTDEWHVRKNLVLSLGLRYEYSTPKRDTMGRTFSIIPGQKSSVFVNAPLGMVFPGDAGAPEGVNFPDRNDWAPRIGFSWDPKGKGKSSLRGAFGVFYDILKAEDNLQFNGKPPFFASAGFAFAPLAGDPTAEVNYMTQPFVAAGAQNPFPSRPPPNNLDFAASGYLPIGASGLFVVDPHLRTPYTYQYHLTYQRELMHDAVFQASYVGASSHGLTALVDANPFVLGTFDRVLNLAPGNSTCTGADPSSCSFANIYEFTNATTSSYNGMLLDLDKQLSGDGPFGKSYFSLAYTYSHDIDSSSGFRNRNSVLPSYHPGLFRASADMDVRHRIVFSGGWELPFDRAWQGGPKRLTQGWHVFPIVSWRTGFPLDVFANLPSAFDYTSPGPSGAGDPGLVHANLVGPVRTFDPHHIQTLGGATGNFWFDPTSFSNQQCFDSSCQPGPTAFPDDSQAVADPTVRTYGTLPRNYFRGPGQVNLDLAFSKSTRIAERLQVEFRGDFFNLLNHAEFFDPNTNINDPNFGKVQFTYQPRIIQLSLRFSF